MAVRRTPKCPQCGAWTDALESREVASHVRRRRYRCANDHIFVTLSEEVFLGMVVGGQLQRTKEPGWPQNQNAG